MVWWSRGCGGGPPRGDASRFDLRVRDPYGRDAAGRRPPRDGDAIDAGERRALLEIWLYVHVPLTVVLIAALIAHVVSVFFYW